MSHHQPARKKIPAGQFAAPARSYPKPDNERAEAAQGVKDNEQAETKKAKANKMLFGGK